MGFDVSGHGNADDSRPCFFLWRHGQAQEYVERFNAVFYYPLRLKRAVGAFGYSLSFAPGSGFWGGFSWAGLNGVGLEPYPDYAATIPHQAFMIFQAMFAVITPALIIGAFAERMKFSAFLLFTILWATFVYDPICHWVWGIGGFLRNMGALILPEAR